MLTSNELELQLERFVAAKPDQCRQAFRELTGQIRKAVKEGRNDEAAVILQRAIQPTVNYNSLQSLYGVYKLLREAGAIPQAKIKLAVLGSFTTRQLRAFIELYLYAVGIVADSYEAEYGVFRQDILDPNSGLHAFAPKIIVLATTWRDLSHRPNFADGRQKVSQLVEAELALWAQLWETAHHALRSQIVQNNFEQPPWRVLGNHEMRHSSGLGRFIALVNQAFQDRAPPFVTIHDVDHLASIVGRWRWCDERVYHYGKLPCALERLPDYAHSVASVILAYQGASKKCLVLDLDNTLWGGIIGDDGLGGIQLGQGSPKGEAYVAFQRYIKALSQRGVILAVCSKNEEAVAKEVFEKHSEMVLRLKDIACFVANWNDKAANLRTIAQRLNIGLNSLVLVDDNPAERSFVRRFAPDVAVPELPGDPAGYIEALEKHRFFQTVSLGAEDLMRTDFYRANVAREEAGDAAGSVDDFLQSLQMKASISPIHQMNLERSVQLINKTNQFNLTTQRYSTAQVLDKVEDRSWITRTVTLSDRFGDNGLISVLLAKVEGDDLHIDTWVMSCRVFKRDVEHFLMNHLVSLAQERGIKRIRGQYIPTARNAIVRDLYPTFGFTETGRSDDGYTFWELAISDDLTHREVYIQEA